MYARWANGDDKIGKIADVRITIIDYSYIEAYRNANGDFHTTVDRNNERHQ